MEVRNVNREELENALVAVNVLFNGNIRFKDISLLRKHTKIGSKEVWRVTLTVNSTHIKIVDSVKPRRVHIETLPGVKVNRNKRIVAVCWHVYGYFMDSLPSDCEIYSSVRTYNGKPAMRKPGEEWYDFNIGSIIYPQYASEACECN